MRNSQVIEVRQLHRGHFAFLRAVLQGVDPVTSWRDHMLLESSRPADRKSREVAAWVRLECIVAARRNGQHHVARLLRLELAVPDVADEAADTAASIGRAARATSLEAPSRVPEASRMTTALKRARLVQRQLNVLVGLEVRMLVRMSAADPVGRWLPSGIAGRLEKAGMPTLSLLVARIKDDGVRWWRDVPAVSLVKAARIADWIRMHAQEIGIRLAPARQGGGQAGSPHHSEPSTTLVPFEHFLVPLELDGHDGAFRLPRGECLLAANNDRQAIEAWLNEARDALRAPGTFYHYRNEAERLLLWCVLVRRKPISSLTQSDAKAYRDFLVDPPDHWCGHRANRRNSPQWRPMEKGLSAVTLRVVLGTLRSMFKFLVAHRYVYCHPFLELRPIDPGRPNARLQRTLTFSQWDRIDGDLAVELEFKSTHEQTRRRVRAIRWLYFTGLSLSEMVALQCGALRPIRFTRADGTSDIGWVVLVVGRRQLTREVPVPPKLVVELGDELARAGLPRAPTDRANARVPIVGRFCAAEGGVPPAWSAASLSKSIKNFMEACASRMDGDDAARVRLATALWLRNTHGMHAVKGRDDGESKPISVHHVAASMGCGSAQLISQYLQSTGAQRQEAMEDFWPPEEAP
jgi:site-specific recombinase XerC